MENGDEGKSISHNDELIKIKNSEAIISLLGTLIAVCAAREISVYAQDMRIFVETICAVGILAGLTVIQILDICIFYMRYETSNKRLW